MSFVELPALVFDRHTGVLILDLNQVCGWNGGMAGDRVGRINKGPRKAQSVRFPLDHYAHHAAQAAALKVPVGEYVAYRIAVIEGLEIPGQVLMANPGLLALLSDDQRIKALAENPGLSARYRALLGQDPLPIEGLSAAVATGEDITQAA